MNRAIEVSEEARRKLGQLASKEGETISECSSCNSVAEVIASRFPTLSPPANGTGGEPPSPNGARRAPRTLAELAEGLVGQVAGAGPHDLAQNHSKYMGEYLEEEHRTRK